MVSTKLCCEGRQIFRTDHPLPPPPNNTTKTEKYLTAPGSVRENFCGAHVSLFNPQVEEFVGTLLCLLSEWSLVMEAANFVVRFEASHIRWHGCNVWHWVPCHLLQVCRYHLKYDQQFRSLVLS